MVLKLEMASRERKRTIFFFFPFSRHKGHLFKSPSRYISDVVSQEARGSNNRNKILRGEGGQLEIISNQPNNLYLQVVGVTVKLSNMFLHTCTSI